MSAEGHRLHQTVPGHKWCVTRADLREFRQLVKQHVLSGKITPTHLDDFSVDDHDIGPCVHTVCQQLIKPLTDSAGGMSWALMKHPEGLECDLFVTHSWNEGIYEFINKVLNSWPRGMRHAYCCMLSNPQNLDISDLIASPAESPFAKALQSSSHMLVVPNCRGSIYSRIWCAYEAFLGYQQGKVIFTATAPISQVIRSVLLSTLISALSFALMYLLLLHLHIHIEEENVDNVRLVENVAIGLAICSLLMESIIQPGLSGKCCAATGAFGTGVYTAGNFYRAVHYVEDNWVMFTMGNAFLGLGACTSAAAAHMDNLYRLQAIEQARQLSEGYTGSLHDAKASFEIDRQAILNELDSSGVEEEVNEAIQVLLVSGMSTPTLRKASETVRMRLKEAGSFNMSMLVLAWAALGWLPINQILNAEAVYSDWVSDGTCTPDRYAYNLDWCAQEFCEICAGFEDVRDYCTGLSDVGAESICLPWQQVHLWSAAILEVEVLMSIIVFMRCRKDELGFAARAITRIAFLAGVLLVYLPMVIGLKEPEENWIATTAMHLFILLAISLMMAGPGRVSSVWLVGPFVTRYLFAGCPCAEPGGMLPKLLPNKKGEFARKPNQPATPKEATQIVP